jgi:hypothetical protein
MITAPLVARFPNRRGTHQGEQQQRRTIRAMRARHWLILIAALVSLAAIASGLVAHLSPEARPNIYVLMALLLQIFTYCWMKADARERDALPPPGAIPLIAAILPVAITYYVMATRRGWHRIVSISALLTYLSILAVCWITGEWIGWLLAS